MSDIYRPPVLTCRSKLKPETAMQHLGVTALLPEHVLIDDFVANERRWRKAGGTCVFYRDVEQTIAEFLAVAEQHNGLIEVFVDLDGVMADFDRFIEHHHGMSFRDMQKLHKGDDTALWQRIATVPGFWHQLPLMPGALRLWKTVLPYRPAILTGCPRTNSSEAEVGKRRWVREQLEIELK